MLGFFCLLKSDSSDSARDILTILFGISPDWKFVAFAFTIFRVCDSIYFSFGLPLLQLWLLQFLFYLQILLLLMLMLQLKLFVFSCTFLVILSILAYWVSCLFFLPSFLWSLKKHFSKSSTIPWISLPIFFVLCFLLDNLINLKFGFKNSTMVIV